MGVYKINRDKCINCGECKFVCKSKAIDNDEERHYITNKCVGCGACYAVCPTKAISEYMVEKR